MSRPEQSLGRGCAALALDPLHLAKDSPLMKTFLRIAGVAVTLVVAIALFGFLLPQTIVIERSIDTSAAPEEIYPLVADLKRWPDWQAWNKEMDPTVTYTFSDPSVGEGAWYEWKGEELSTRRVAITGVEEGWLVDYTVDFAGSGANPGTMKFLPGGKKSRTRIVWSFECDMGFSPVGRYIGLMMKGMLNRDFDTGLANLKKLAESEAVGTTPRSVEASTAAPAEAAPAAPVATEEEPGSGDDAPATDPVPADAGPDTNPSSKVESTETDEAGAVSADDASKEEAAGIPD